MNRRCLKLPTWSGRGPRTSACRKQGSARRRSQSSSPASRARPPPLLPAPPLRLPRRPPPWTSARIFIASTSRSSEHRSCAQRRSGRRATSSARSSTKSATSLPSPSSPAPSRASASPSPSRWAWILGLAVTVAFLAWAVRGTQWSDVLAGLRAVDPLLLVLTVALATLTFPIRLSRCRVLLRAKRVVAMRERDPGRVAGPVGGARRRHGRGPRGRPHGAEAPRAVRGDAVLVVGALAHERRVVRGVLPGVRVAGADRRIPPAARDPRVRGGGPGVGRLLRRLRESDAADVAALRHQSEPGAGVRGRVSRFHVPADHAARPALACECPPPPGRPGSGTDSRSTGGRETVTDAVRVAAHAKLNLLLRILAREAPAGYHQIETAFALLELTDELMVTRTAGGVALTVHGPDLGAPEQNLAVRAARAVLEATGHKFGVALELTKRIPVQSGLGGGSSDGAAAR